MGLARTPWIALALAVLACGGERDEGPPVEPECLREAVAHPPSDPLRAPSSSGVPTVYAVRTWYLGERYVGGPQDASAWESIGMDLDGLWSSPECPGAGHCVLPHGAARNAAFHDGVGGIDNAFGRNLSVWFALWAGDQSFLSERASHPIERGESTALIRIPSLGAADEQSELVVEWMDAAARGSPPRWDGLDEWPVCNGGVQASSGYLVNDTLVFGPPGTIDVRVPIDEAAGGDFVLTIHQPTVALQVSADRSSGSGVLAGVLLPAEASRELLGALGFVSETLCDGPTGASVVAQVASLVDVPSGASSLDGSAPCDGISIGLAFDAAAARVGPNAEAPARLPSPCFAP